MNMHVLPVHKQYIKYSSVLLAFYDSSMVKHREVRAVSFSKMKMNIVIFITTVNLFPDASFYLFLLILPNQVMKAFICKSKEFVHIFLSGHMKKLLVCIEQLIIFFVCSVYDKCTRKMLRDILKRKSQLFADT